MSTELAEAIERLAIGPDGDSLAACYALSDKLAAKLTMVAAAFDAGGGWGVDGDVSMAACLSPPATPAPTEEPPA